MYSTYIERSLYSATLCNWSLIGGLTYFEQQRAAWYQFPPLYTINYSNSLIIQWHYGI